MENEVIVLKDAESFIDSLPIKFQAKTYWTLQLLERFGSQLTQPYTKYIKSYKNIRELRIKFGSDINRLFYFQYKSKIFVVTSGYVKKSKKLDKHEIERAIRIMKRFIKEQENEKT